MGLDPEPEWVTASRVEMVARARQRQLERQGVLNAVLPRESIPTDWGVTQTFGLAGDRRHSGEGDEHLLRVARTVADCDGAKEIAERHVEEAASYWRPLTRDKSKAV